jgi:hypothetical protein
MNDSGRHPVRLNLDAIQPSLHRGPSGSHVPNIESDDFRFRSIGADGQPAIRFCEACVESCYRIQQDKATVDDHNRIVVANPIVATSNSPVVG